MGKLFNLKEWLTVADTARHLTIVFGEEVTAADVLRLALDKRLRLSVYFVNYAQARCGKTVGYAAVVWAPYPSEITPADLNLPDGQSIDDLRYMKSLKIDDERFLNPGDEVTIIQGVWDLVMVGAERVDVERRYQGLVGGPSVGLTTLDGALVSDGEGLICQLQQHIEHNESRPGSMAQLLHIKKDIANGKYSIAETEARLTKHAEDRKKFLEMKRPRPDDNFEPAHALPDDGVLVVRTGALREFEASIVATSAREETRAQSKHDHRSNKLAILNQAAERFWANADRNDRTTHEMNATVVAWLIGHDYTPSLAEKAASIIRPEWASRGRPPGE